MSATDVEKALCALRFSRERLLKQRQESRRLTRELSRRLADLDAEIDRLESETREPAKW
jgi:hypothetical protein